MVLHPSVETLIDTVVDTPLKLQILQRFHEQPQLVVNARGLADQIFCDLWSADAALCELTADGVLAVACDAGEPSFQYAPRPDHNGAILRLFTTYDDPLLRDVLHGYLREVSGYAAYRRATLQHRSETRRRTLS